ncbi:uncharacterized protein LOC129981252 isoform X2 [Argiope bruennichi]|nr:uncharacterized protein LOC129981252 isoform X2 [Argiope bruennichi]XP_055947992.1 uncharacterized protein LOC129981252 isoform X2 [Argiope bruennichi]XP_055947993.1 uncharacterized protein LOC129981252 isoform X2 [Argiope bruennichi]XP_055947994.1 uncharacterized protein LOC129981252 isoform X2 [Argiope bruennichi]XP_055947995.1 uncharacterized protein LOC129981252 isoform X2 [Argiope bruennichi]
MFGNEQDTGLLLNSLLSAVKSIQSEESYKKREFDLENEDDAVTIISSTINSLTRGVRTNSTEETLDKQLHLQRRCHAAIFFTVLRSNGINCAEANKYYESIVHTFPTLSWKFYMKLNFRCKWSEYFIECSKELQPNILATVLNKILYVEWNEEEHLKYYSWHTVLQAIIWKFFIIEDSSLSSSQDSYTFAFPFVSSNVETGAPGSTSKMDKDSFANSQILHSFNNLLNLLDAALISSLSSFDFIKIILHAYKTVFRLLSKVKTCEKDVIKELFRLNNLIETCCLNKESLDVIKAILQRKDEQIPLSHYYTLTSWEISGNYLIFLLCNYWDDILKLTSEEINTPYISLKECFPQSDRKESFRNLSPFFKTNFEKDDSHYVLSLKIIITLHYPCATRAAVILLLHPEIRELDDVLKILEGVIEKLDSLEIYPVLADTVTTAQSKDAKMRLLNLFFKTLSGLPGKIYNDALGHILNHYGVNDHFQLNDFNDQLDCFTRKMLSNDEAEKCLLPLFIQSPRDVIKRLIEQALLQGSKEITVVDILKQIPIACLYSNTLVEELKPYFIKDEVVVKEMQNMIHLIESLMEIHAETPIVDFEMFLQEIIIPAIAAERNISFTLECLKVSANILVPKNALKIKTGVLLLLINCLNNVVSKCIQFGDGKIKELAVTTLSILESSEVITDTLKTICHDDASFSYSPCVLVYNRKLLGVTSYQELKGVESKLNDSLWLWCCNNKVSNLFQETILEKKITYEDLISILISVLPHLTKEEWFESARLIREYVKYSNLDVSCTMPWLLPKSDPQLYAVIRCLMDSYYFSLEKGVFDLYYMSNCFTNTMQKILSEEVDLHLYLNVFLDVCHLTLNNADEIYTSLLPFLLNVKRTVEDKCKDKHLKVIYLQLLCDGIKGLPNSEEKLSFFSDNLVN